MKLKTAFVVLFFSLLINVWGKNGEKEVSGYFSFDHPDTTFYKGLDAVRQSGSLQLVFNPSYCDGIKGMALDLTENVPVRIPLCLEKKQHPVYDQETSFSIQLWIRTLPGAEQGTAVMANKKGNDKESPGWIMGTKENGAWYWHMNDGNTRFDYEPTAQKQSINDGKWHQLTVSLDRKKKELQLFFDGRNVAIYHIAGLKSLESELRTVIGGTDEYQDWGSRGEWTSFNGMIDEVRFWNHTLTASEVKQSYERFFPSDSMTESTPDRLKIQVWNIWHGGHRFGQHVGLKRTIEILKKEQADIIGLIETYGSGPVIADSLGYYFYLISSNLSIMSRYPIEETIQVYRPFNSGGALINLGNNKKIAFFDIWLHYLPDMCDLTNPEVLEKFKEEETKTRASEINSILKEIEHWTAHADQIPVIMVGDFNADSHIDWSEKYQSMHQGIVMPFPVSASMEKAGYTDSYRHLHPDVFSSPGSTWSPLINAGADQPNCVFCRIDFIYSKGNQLVPYFSSVLDHHPVFWPSDHGSVTTHFYLK